MDEDKDDPSFEPGDNPGQKKKVTFKPASMVDMKPCDDLHRYLVDKFHSSTKSKSVLFEAIDFSAYKTAAKVVSFVTSEDRLLLWIKTFAVRYFDHLNVMGYRVTWQEQESHSCPTKSDKIIMHIHEEENNIEDQMVTITIFISTGRIMVQGKKFAEWSQQEFPALLSIVNSLGSSGNLSAVSAKDKSTFHIELQKFFTKYKGCEIADTRASELNDTTVENAENVVSDITETETPSADKGNTRITQLSTPIELSLTPSRLNTLTTLRNTVGNLEADFTEFKVTNAGNLEHLKDKAAQLDHNFKVQTTTLGGLADDLENNTKLLNHDLQKHADLISKLQNENQALQKKNAKISEDNATMRRTQNQLEAEITFLKDQIKALWETIQLPPETTKTSSQTSGEEMDDKFNDSTKNKAAIPTSNDNQWSEDEILLVNLPTSNSFSPLQDLPENPPRKEPQNKPVDTNSQHPPKSPATNDTNNSNEVIFLCDSNGKFLDMEKMFPSDQEVKYVRTPLIEHARSYLQSQIHTAPRLLILHTGTNDLERTSSPEDLISNILILITEASTKFPSSKIFYSTLLPRSDIPTPIITSINNQLISSCSRLPNVQLVKHDNLFENQSNILYDQKHILKRYVKFFAKNLKDAIRGRARPKPTVPSNTMPAQRQRSSQTQPTSSQGPKPLLHHTSYSNAVKNTPPQVPRWPHLLQTQPPPLPFVTPQLPQRIPPTPLQNSLHHEPNASNKAFQLPMQTLPDQILPAPPPTISHQYSKTPHQTFPQAAKMETAGEETRPSNKLTDSAMPQEIISFLRFIKSFV